MQWAQNKKGFTIVELLIVIVVIAILAAITIVSYNGIQSQARAAVFVNGVDSFEKAIHIYKAQAGSFAPTLYTSLTSSGTNSSGYSLLSQPSCAPGAYPATDVFEEGECTAMKSVITYDGDSTPARTTDLRYTENENFAAEYEALGIGSYAEMPDVNGFVLRYSVRQQITQASAASAGYVNPRDGWVTSENIFARRGVTVSATRVNSVVTQVTLSYYLQGDQTCGRGERSLVDMGDLFGAEAGVTIESSSGLATQCALILR